MSQTIRSHEAKETPPSPNLLNRSLRPSEKVEQFLQNFFEGNTLAGGDRLPSSRALAQQIGISEGTVRNVVSRWKREGKLEVLHGSGTYVRNRITRPGKLHVSLNACLNTLSVANYDGWFRHIFQTVTEYMMKQGPRISLTSLYSENDDINAMPPKEVLDRCIEVDGMILTPGDPHSPLITEYCRKANKPYMTINALRYPDTVNFVTTDTFTAYQRAASALRQAGRKRFALFISPNAIKSPSMANRAAGVCAGIGNSLGGEVSLRIIDCKGVHQEHAVSALSWLIDNEGYLPDALLFSGDPHAIGGMKELSRRGISVPEEVSVISGADTHNEIEELQLTSFKLPTHQIGQSLASMLVHMLDQQLSELPGCSLPVEITLRKSTTDKENFLLSEQK